MFIKRVSLIFLLTFAIPCMADALSGQIMVYVSDAQVMEVGDEPEHMILLAKIKGLAVLEGGEVGTLIGVEVADNRAQGGSFFGYVTMAFDDDSTTSFRFEGVQDSGTGKYHAILAYTMGTGRFAGIEGKGELNGRNYDEIEGSYATFESTYVTSK